VQYNHDTVIWKQGAKVQTCCIVMAGTVLLEREIPIASQNKWPVVRPGNRSRRTRQKYSRPMTTGSYLGSILLRPAQLQTASITLSGDCSCFESLKIRSSSLPLSPTTSHRL
jgi:hypothetical protein